jgi:ABC transporter with metal-binding/Fe-S-binding domain ATP-binding protein
MKVASLFSGGKDSNFANYIALQNGFEISCLVSILTKNEESYMFHVPNIELTRVQAKAMGIPIISINTTGEKEKELDDLKKALLIAKRRHRINGVISGAIQSDYQKTRIDRICEELKLSSFSFLWRKNEEKVIREEVNANFEIIIVGCFAAGFTKDWLGRKIDEECINDLIKLNKKFGINICGEGGEIETFVTDCALFKKRIKIEKAEKIWKNGFGVYQIKKISLIKKY